MKRLWIALAILAFILSGTLIHTWRLTRFTEELSGLLLHSEQLAEAGRWDDAAHMAEQAFHQWDVRGGYLNITLQHADIDDVKLSFSELREYIEHRELDQCAAATARLVSQLELLAEMEHPTLKNIL